MWMDFRKENLWDFSKNLTANCDSFHINPYRGTEWKLSETWITSKFMSHSFFCRNLNCSNGRNAKGIGESGNRYLFPIQLIN